MIKLTRSKKSEEQQYIALVNDLTKNTPKGYRRLSQCPEVIMAVDRIADLVSNMTIYLMENTDNGDVRIKNNLSRKIDINPLRNVTKKNWIKAIVRCLLLEGDGNAVVKPVYKDGLIDDLIVVPAGDFSIDTGKDFEDKYSIQIKNKKYKPEDVIHFVLNPDPDNIHKGKSYRIPLKQLVDSLKSADDIEKEFMNGRINPALIIGFQGDFDELQQREEHIYNTYFSQTESGKPWIVPNNMFSFEQIKPLSLNDIALTDTVTQNKQTIAGLLGVPAFFVGAGEYNAEEYNAFIREKVASIAKTIEQTLTQSLLLSPDYYFKFNIRSLYNYDLQTTESVGADLYRNGIITGNEVRDWMGLSPMEGLDELVILENFIPVEDVGNQKKLEGGNDEGET